MIDIIGLPWESTYQNIDTPDSWLPVIEKLHKDLLAIDPDYRVAQVKEKFGRLRYYAYPSAADKSLDGNEAFYARIRHAEEEVDRLP